MSLRTRLLIAFAYVMVLVLVALELPLGINLSRRVNAEVKAEAAGQAQIVSASAAGSLGSPATLERLARSSAEELNGRVIVVDRTGRLIADSAAGGRAAPVSYSSRPEISSALDGRTDQGIRHSDSLDQDLLYTAVPVLRGARPVGAVRVTQSVDAVQREVRNDILALIAVGAVALLLGMAVAWLLAGSLTRPLRSLSRTARRVAGGDLQARAPLQGSSEQQEVAKAFNDMTEQLSRMLAAQQEFVANASHQLRTPLTGLRLRLESAAALSDDAEVRAQIAAAERETERLARLLTNLLELAREAERPPAGGDVSLAEAAQRACERWRGPVERGGGSITCDGEHDPHVKCSAEDIAIVLDNLVENAVKYSPPGSEVELRWGTREGSGFVAVLDRGPGLSKEEQARVFDRFYRGGASTTSGTGLGLSIVSTLVKRWGGTARIRDREGGGARAEVTLPAIASPRDDAGSGPKRNQDFADALPDRS